MVAPTYDPSSCKAEGGASQGQSQQELLASLSQKTEQEKSRDEPPGAFADSP